MCAAVACSCGRGGVVWFGVLCTGEVILHYLLSPLVYVQYEQPKFEHGCSY